MDVVFIGVENVIAKAKAATRINLINADNGKDRFKTSHELQSHNSFVSGFCYLNPNMLSWESYLNGSMLVNTRRTIS